MAFTYVVGYPIISDDEIRELGYTYGDGEIVHVTTRDIPQLLVELKLFNSKRLARTGTPRELDRIYGDRELDIIEWRRRKPWPALFTFIVGAGTEWIRNEILTEITCRDIIEKLNQEGANRRSG